MKSKKRGKKIVLIFFAVIATLLIGLILNNRIAYLIYSSKNTEADQLTPAEIAEARDILNYLDKNGDSIFTGFDGSSTDLILYNEKYEFLLSKTERDNFIGWEEIGYDEELARYGYRREAKNSQAFAVKVGKQWVGSFSTHTYYNKSITEQIPVFIPPQLFRADDEYYRAIVIHEMTHAFQGNLANDRVDTDEHYNNVSEKYFSDSTYEELITQEAKYLEEAISSNNTDDSKKLLKAFMETRLKRRTSCNLSAQEITMEKELEWLEGCARYAEYEASRDSASSIPKDLIHIEKRVKSYKADERFYVLGMAEVLLLSRTSDNWQEKILKDGYTLEDCLMEAYDIH